MNEKTDKVAIITGASRGIGAVLAERLAQDGFAVVVNYAGSKAQAETLVSKIEASGGRALAVQADVADAKAVGAMFDAADNAFGGVDVLINNAGVMLLDRIADASDESFDKTIAINLKGTFNGLREAAKRLRNGGRIVNFSSSVVGVRYETYAIYGATKAAIEVMTTIAAKELRGRNITVNAVAPGPVATEMFLNGKSQELVERLAKIPPLERLGTPDDIARVVSFLVGPEGGWINAQVIRANGGLV